MREGQVVAEFLLALAQAHTEQPAVDEGRHRLLDMIAGLGQVFDGGGMGGQALAGVFDPGDQLPAGDAHHPADGQQLEPVGPGDEKHAERGRQDAGRRAEVGLEHDQEGNGAHQDTERDDPVEDVAQPGLFGRQPRRHIDDDGELRQLAGLERALKQRTLGLKTRFAEAQHQNQQQDDAQHHRDRDRAPDVVIQPRQQHQHHQADSHRAELPQEEIGGVVRIAGDLVTDVNRRAVDHQQADRAQHTDHQNQVQVEPGGVGAAALGHPLHIHLRRGVRRVPRLGQGIRIVEINIVFDVARIGHHSYFQLCSLAIGLRLQYPDAPIDATGPGSRGSPRT